MALSNFTVYDFMTGIQPTINPDFGYDIYHQANEHQEPVFAPDDNIPILDYSSSSTSQDSYNNRNVYDDYLDYLEKGSKIGLFATAQDVVDQANLDRAFQSLEAQKNRDWYEDMSDSAYQRQVKDLEAAGLNPILGFARSAGSGAPVAAQPNAQGRASNLSAIAPNLSDYLNAGAHLISSTADLIKFFKPMLSALVK